MKIIKASTKINRATPDMEELIEYAGRVCYASDDMMKSGSYEKFIKNLIASKHESVLEHAAITVTFTVDRGVSHELVRHRHTAFSQESTRYVSYAKEKHGKEIKVIEPCYFDRSTEHGNTLYSLWLEGCRAAEGFYMDLLTQGATAQEARAVLPNSTATRVVTTASPREWRHIFALRCDKTAHPQMREVMIPLREEFAERWPVLFSDMLPESQPLPRFAVLKHAVGAHRKGTVFHVITGNMGADNATPTYHLGHTRDVLTTYIDAELLELIP